MPTEFQPLPGISRKRRAQEPASSPRSYKQPRLSPNPGLSRPPDEKETKLVMFVVWVRDRITSLFGTSSPPLSTRDQISDEESTIETVVRSISPERIPDRRDGVVPSISRNNFSTIEEIPSIPFHGSGSDLQSTPKGHHRPSSSVTTMYSNSTIEQLLVEDIKNIRLDSSHSSLQSSQITSSSFSRGSTVQSKETTSISRKFRPSSRPHIGQRKFKASVREGNREALKLRMYQVRKHHREIVDGRSVKGHLNLSRIDSYSKSEKAAMNFADYQLLLRNLGVDKPPNSRFVRGTSPRMTRLYFESENRMKRTLDNAKATLNSPKRLSFNISEDRRKKMDRIKDAAIEALLRGIPDHLPTKEEEEVDAILRKRGVVAKFAREQVSDADISRLSPGQWLNDEIINFYGAMILARSESNKENAQVVGNGGRNGSLDVHYFSSFFWAKLYRDGYERGRLAKWTKKINIFSKDVILIPINHSNAHWTAAAINFRKKRIESYDSMGVAKLVVFTQLRAYLDAEHRDKKKKPFDFTGWENVAPDNTPQQANGWDCGVFTCHFLEAMSRGEEQFAFCQPNMPYLRRRMIWEIGNAQLRNADYK